MSLNKEIWKESKPAREYPKDWIVIPALDVTDLIRKKVEELKDELHSGSDYFAELGHGSKVEVIDYVRVLIDKIFGDELTKEKNAKDEKTNKFE